MSSQKLPLTTRLRQYRKLQKLSQFELSMELGVSQRHVSFVESGRSRVSRSLLLSWLRVLQVPLVQINESLLSAGYAPEHPVSAIDDPGLESARIALKCLLEAHDPVPAFVLNENWDIKALNNGATWLAQTLVPSLIGKAHQDSLNMLDLFTDPCGLGPLILNIDDVGPRFISMLEMEAAANSSLTPRVESVRRMFEQQTEKNSEHENRFEAAPALTTIFSSPLGSLGFISVFSTFGTPHDITLASLRVEHLFPADGFTRSVLEKNVV